MSCAPSTQGRTACEFIAHCSDAMPRKSALRVLIMEADRALLVLFARNAVLREKLVKFDPEQRRGELERLFHQKDLWWKAWCMTRYAGERVHGAPLDVRVQFSGAHSQVILVQADDGILRLHPPPGWGHARPEGSSEGATDLEGP